MNYYVGNYVIWTIYRSDGVSFEGNTDNWYQLIGESWEPVFQDLKIQELNNVLKGYKEKYD